MDQQHQQETSISSPPSKMRSQLETRKRNPTWSDLPPDLLQQIGEKLPIVELLGFRSACKDWRSASSTASAECEYTPNQEPWFLLYNGSSDCCLYPPTSSSDKYSKNAYTIHIPELDGATCIASKEGWLLLFRDDSMFFLCPFSNVKIDLPKFPHSDLSDHVAVFTSPPTSPDCIVCVINHSEKNNMEINMLRRGSNEWVKYVEKNYQMETISCATFVDGIFYFLDNKDHLLTFSIAGRKCERFRVVDETVKDVPTMPFISKTTYSSSSKLNQRLSLEKGGSLSTCGTVLPRSGTEAYIHNEYIRSEDETNQCCNKGIWIHPRFFQVPPNQSWSL